MLVKQQISGFWKQEIFDIAIKLSKASGILFKTFYKQENSEINTSCNIWTPYVYIYIYYILYKLA